MVELKRWVAKESTDNGQVVEDSKLTDQAIFDRLERTLRFDPLRRDSCSDTDTSCPRLIRIQTCKGKTISPPGTARRLVQIERRRFESLRPQKNDRDLERTGTCDPRRDQDCLPQSPANRQNTRVPNGMPALRRILSDARASTHSASAANPASRWTAARYRSLGGTSADSLAPNPDDFRLVKRDANPLTGFQSQGQGLNDTLPLTRSLPSAPVDRSANTGVSMARAEWSSRRAEGIQGERKKKK